MVCMEKASNLKKNATDSDVDVGNCADNFNGGKLGLKKFCQTCEDEKITSCLNWEACILDEIDKSPENSVLKVKQRA